ncbi:MAG TPA: DMT family transporter [Rhizobiaceae bacterium]|nr:DMT family transporter [Rhizobiaceae bacterium]
MGRSADWLIALAAGAVLAAMIQVNSVLAAHSTAFFASWIAHGVGALAALAFMATISWKVDAGRMRKPPLWSYLGGIPGAFTVVLASVTINGGLSLSVTIALMLAGQVAFGMAADQFGLFGVMRRKLGGRDLLVVLAVLAGSLLLLFGGA